MHIYDAKLGILWFISVGVIAQICTVVNNVFMNISHFFFL